MIATALFGTVMLVYQWPRSELALRVGKTDIGRISIRLGTFTEILRPELDPKLRKNLETLRSDLWPDWPPDNNQN